MLRTVSLVVAGVATIGYGTAAFAQTHYDPTPEHIYYYGPAEQAANAAAATQAPATARKAHAQASHMTQTRHAHGHAAPASQTPASQKHAPQG